MIIKIFEDNYLPVFKICNKVRTLRTLIIPNKKAPDGADFKNGASNGINFEPEVNYIVEFLHLCLHDEDTIEQIKGIIVDY